MKNYTLQTWKRNTKAYTSLNNLYFIVLIGSVESVVNKIKQIYI